MGCFLNGPLKYGSLVLVTLYCGHPCFWNFYSAIVVVVETYVNYLFDPMCVPGKVTINRLALNEIKWSFTSLQSGSYIPLLWAYFSMAEVWVWTSQISLTCSLIISCVDLLVLPKLTILHTVNHLVLFSWVNSVFKLYLMCGRSVVSNLKTALTPYCFRQQRRWADLWHRKKLKWIAGQALVLGWCVYARKKRGQPLEIMTDILDVFSLER